MKSDEDITTYNIITQENRLFNFLGGLDGKFDAIRREILRLETLPSVESAYTTVRKETAKLQILTSAAEDGVDSSSSWGIGVGLITKSPGDRSQGQNQKGRTDLITKSGKPYTDKSKLRCSHCEISKHTRETCFKLIGFPDWWEDGHKLGKSSNLKAAIVVGNQKAASSGDDDQEKGVVGENEGNRGFAAIGFRRDDGANESDERGKGGFGKRNCKTDPPISNPKHFSLGVLEFLKLTIVIYLVYILML